MFRFNTTYFTLTLLLLITEVLIAVYVHDNFVRPYIGDLLVVVLLYCFTRCFANIAVLPAATGSLLFACLVEGLQYLRFVERIGLGDNRIANIVIGNSFAWGDMVAYTAGAALVLVAEKICRHAYTSSKHRHP